MRQPVPTMFGTINAFEGLRLCRGCGARQAAPLQQPASLPRRAAASRLAVSARTAEVGVGLFGTKAGMTQIFTADGLAVPATVIALEDGNIVTQVKTPDTDGYSAVQVRRSTAPHNTAPPPPPPPPTAPNAGSSPTPSSTIWTHSLPTERSPVQHGVPFFLLVSTKSSMICSAAAPSAAPPPVYRLRIASGDVPTCTKNYAVIWNLLTSGAPVFDLTVGHKSWPQTAKFVPYFVEKVRRGYTVSASCGRPSRWVTGSRRGRTSSRSRSWAT